MPGFAELDRLSNEPRVVWNTHTIREVERKSIHDFVRRNNAVLRGRVLDFGAGKPGTCAMPQPYRDLVTGEYVPFDKGDPILGEFQSFDAILCTQVMQYLDKPWRYLEVFFDLLKPHGHLLLTYPTSWDEVEDTDLWRFTKHGMERLLLRAGFTVLQHERRAEIELGGFKFPLGYGCLARK